MLLSLKILFVNMCLAMGITTGTAPSIVVFEGDSLIASAKWANDLQSQSPWRANDPAHWRILAKSGSTAVDLIARNADVTQLKPAKHGDGILFISVGTNDLRSGMYDSTQTYTNLKTLWSAGRRDGFAVVAFTMHSVPCSEKCELERIKLNTAIRAKPELYDGLVPLDTLFPSNKEEGMFIDQIHFDTLGDKRMVEFVRPMIAKINIK